MRVLQEEFGYVDNQLVRKFTFVNDNGIEITCINYGCIITKIKTPDKSGHYENIVLGYDHLNEYVEDTSCFGCVIGRVAGRIGGAFFELDGETFSLAKNENNNHLHGGLKGFNRVIWDAAIIQSEEEAGVQFSYNSPDGEEGYPGNVAMKIRYTLNNENELTIHYDGISDKTTLLNVTNHSYFNLSGNLKRDVLNHTLQMKSSRFLELNDELLPTGEIREVSNTPFDFRNGREIKTGVESVHPQNILAGNGYDHPFILDEKHDGEVVLHDRESGRVLTIETDEAGVVVYTGNKLPSDKNIRDVPSRKHLGICLETQGLPDAVHHPHFPSWILEKGKEYTSKTIYKFGVVE